MKISILLIVFLISIGFLFSVTSLGEQGFLLSLLSAFGVLCLIGFFGLLLFAKKRQK
ncbi:hypothetical protein [Paraglaciecola hydrolytica]|uniref:hypothetical protein n=1 Tax=Paraglaciecola hydrolytica TaxID=1799789 RepID=UPI000AB212D6|nr:hypothetical protein [Paraglaciecola hydrolytica]